MPLALVLLVLCATSDAQEELFPGQWIHGARPGVILIRGGFGYWPGAQAMADEFCSLGYCPTVIKDFEYCCIAKQVACAIRQGRMSEVIIVGYSSGGDTACLLAHRLGRYGVRVPIVVLIDPTLGLTVPENVDTCVNFYASRALDMIPLFRGVPVSAESPATTVTNINVRDFPEFADHFKRNHFVVGSTAIMREMTVQVVGALQTVIASSPACDMTGQTLFQPAFR